MDAPSIAPPEKPHPSDTALDHDADERFDTPFGSVRVVTRASALRPEDWQATFGGTAKDFRYYEICETTLRQPNFDYRYLLLTGRDGRVRALQPLFFTDQDLTAGLGAGPGVGCRRGAGGCRVLPA